MIDCALHWHKKNNKKPGGNYIQSQHNGNDAKGSKRKIISKNKGVRCAQKPIRNDVLHGYIVYSQQYDYHKVKNGGNYNKSNQQFQFESEPNAGVAPFLQWPGEKFAVKLGWKMKLLYQ